MTKMLPPKASHCETEYRRSFKKSRFTCSATTYQHNLDFRTEQKRRFVEHNPEPFAWDPEDIESDSGSDRSCEDRGRSNRLTHTQYKHEKLNRLYEKRMSGKREEPVNGESGKESTRDKSWQESDDEGEGIDEEQDGGSESESEASVVHVIEPEFVEEPARRTVSAHPVANKQTQTDRKMTLHMEKKNSSLAPFVPYGYEADVKETGKKLTHNVRAAQDIYPSALRAQRNRRTAGQQNHNRGKNSEARLGKSAQVTDRLRLINSAPVGIFVHSDELDDPDWVTEYDRNFQLYDSNSYRSRPESARVHARELVPQLSCRARRKIPR